MNERVSDALSVCEFCWVGSGVWWKPRCGPAILIRFGLHEKKLREWVESKGKTDE